MKKNKQEIIAVRADATLIEAMKGIPNRSEFIREAILAALNNTCPFCQGSGIMTPNQRKHWDELAEDHTFVECDDCGEPKLACSCRKKVQPGPDGEHAAKSSRV
jgi:hypothetical protein